MSEERPPYGDEKSHMEVFNVNIEYKEVDLQTGNTTAKQFYCDALALDASAALSQSLIELTRPPLVGIKIWDIRADVTVQSDELRDKLTRGYK